MQRTLLAVLLPVATLVFAGGGCGQPPNLADDSDGTELRVGDIDGEDTKADGNWGSALTCKPVPNLPPLKNPRITVSLNGKTVHVVDPETGYDKVFGVGVGKLQTDEAEPEFGESLSYYPVIATGKNDFTLKTSAIQPCKTWYTDPDTGEKSPVFAGLPFMPFYGGYALHGPIDNFKAPNGGTLRRGYVSHGCIRMQSEDVLEIYARIKNLVSVPVRLQREPERLADGRRVELADRFIGSECAVDADCNYAGGVCQPNPLGGRGFCSKACTSTCPDKAGFPTTFCVADPQSATAGICVAKVTAPLNSECRPSDHMIATTTKRFKQTASASVCLPGTRGFIGDRCSATAPCSLGNTCVGATANEPGMCTQSCTSACPDLENAPWTFCGKEPSLTATSAASTCLRECTPVSNGSECSANEDCVARVRTRDGKQKYACISK